MGLDDIIVNIRKGVTDLTGLIQTRQKLTELGVNVKKATSVFGRFKMEMLSVMFFGMGIARFFGGLFQPVLNMVGLFDLWNTVLAIFFLPTGLKLLRWMIIFQDKLLGLNPTLQETVNILTAGAYVFGQILFYIGMMSLGVGGLRKLFFELGGILSWIGGIFASIGLGAILIILGFLVLAVLGFFAAWKDNIANIKGWVDLMLTGLKEFFKGIWDTIMGIKEILVGLFTGDIEKVYAGARKLWEGIKGIFRGFLKFIWGFIVTVGISLFTGFMNLIGTLTILLGRAFGVLWEKVLKPLGGFIALLVINPIIKMFNWVIDKINWFIGLIQKIPLVQKAAKALGLEAGTWKIPAIPEFQKGGFVPYTGLFKLHEGETVVPAGNTINFTPNITISATSNVDIDRAINQLSEEWLSRVDRMIRR